MKQFTNIFALVVLAVTLACIPSLTYAQVTQEWVQLYNPTSQARTNSMAIDNAGNVFCTGYQWDGTTGSFVLLKYDASGTLLWSRINSAGRTAYSIAVDGNGDAIITGRTNSSPGGVTMKYDAYGTLLWTQAVTDFTPLKVVVDESNNAYISGSGANLVTVKYNSSGVQQWIATYSAGSVGTADRGLFYKNGFVYVTGGVSSAILTLKYNATNGSQVWTATYNSFDQQNSMDIVADGSGNVYVAGTVWKKLKGGANLSWNVNWVTLKYNSSGAFQWAKTYDGNANDVSYASISPPSSADYPSVITLDVNGNPCVTGVSYTKTGSFTSHDITTIKYSPTGTQLWVKTYDGPQHTDDAAFSITTTSSGSVYVAGVTAENGGNTNATALKYNSSGVQQWVATYDGGTGIADKANSVRLDNSGNVYMSGYSGNNALLVKYSQTGTPKETRGDENLIPTGMSLSQNFPNPFNPSTTITYSLTEDSPVVLKVFNVLGMEVATLANETKSVGTHTTVFHAEGLESGMYTYELSVAGRTMSKRMLLLK